MMDNERRDSGWKTHLVKDKLRLETIKRENFTYIEIEKTH